MCGRYAATKDPAALMREFDALDGTDGPPRGPDYNVAPTKDVVTVVQRHPRDADGNPLADEPSVRSLRMMRWGLVPFWAKDPSVGAKMINTRAETAREKPAFRKALSRRRCLVPADGWYEWKAGDGGKRRKEPFFTTTRDGSSLAFAGLWETWRDPKGETDASPLITCSIITTDAVGPLADVHHRMPLALPSDRWAAWLDPDRADATDLLRPPEEPWVDTLELRPVSTRVNSVRNNGPELVERADPEPTDLDDGATGALFELPQQ